MTNREKLPGGQKTIAVPKYDKYCWPHNFDQFDGYAMSWEEITAQVRPTEGEQQKPLGKPTVRVLVPRGSSGRDAANLLEEIAKSVLRRPAEEPCKQEDILLTACDVSAKRDRAVEALNELLNDSRFHDFCGSDYAGTSWGRMGIEVSTALSRLAKWEQAEDAEDN